MRKTTLAAAALLLGAAAPAAAQTFPTDDAVIRRAWTLGMEQSQLVPLAQALLDSIGPRLSGAPGQKAGNDWLLHMYRSWGIPAANEQVGTWRGWRRGHAHIDMLAPRLRTLEGTLLGYSPGTNGQTVIAETVILPQFRDSAEFVAWLPQARGKVVLLSPPPVSCRPMSEWREHATEASLASYNEQRRLAQEGWTGGSVRGTGYGLALGTGRLGMRLEEAGVAGMISYRPKDQAGTHEIFETHNRRAPAITLACEDYGLVFRTTERGQGTQLRMNLDGELLGEQPIYNTIATVRGSQLPNEYVMLSAHFDSWDGASGATDNGTGTLVMMEAMRILRQVYPNPKRTIIAGHWTAEEKGLVGARAYAEDHPDVVAGLHAFFNQDNGTGRIMRINAAGLPNAAAQMNEWLAKIPAEMRAMLNNGQPIGPGSPSGGGSDDAAFACHGAPAFGLGSLSWNYGASTWHSNRDTFDKLVFDDLRYNATLIAMLTYLASEAPSKVTRERIDLGQGRAWPACTRAPRQTLPRL